MEMLEGCERNMIHRCFIMSLIGVSLKYCRNKSTLDATLDSLHALTNHKSSAGKNPFFMFLDKNCSYNLGSL